MLYLLDRVHESRATPFYGTLGCTYYFGLVPKPYAIQTRSLTSRPSCCANQTMVGFTSTPLRTQVQGAEDLTVGLATLSEVVCVLGPEAGFP